MLTHLDVAPSHDALAFIARPTPQLRATLRQQETVLPPVEFTDFVACIRSLFEKYTAKLLEFPAGAERATALHQMMDRELGTVAALPLTCRAGCSGCCHYEVEITHDEAEVLKAIVLNGFPLDRDRLEEQAARERKSPAWGRLGHAQNRCVFLGKSGACQIYEDRPAICRKHLVTSPASACTTAGAAVAPVQVLTAEILLSAATSLEGATSASLPKMLHAALAADARERAPDARTASQAVPTLPPGRATLRNPAVQTPPA